MVAPRLPPHSAHALFTIAWRATHNTAQLTTSLFNTKFNTVPLSLPYLGPCPPLACSLPPLPFPAPLPLPPYPSPPRSLPSPSPPHPLLMMHRLYRTSRPLGWSPAVADSSRCECHGHSYRRATSSPRPPLDGTPCRTEGRT